MPQWPRDDGEMAGLIRQHDWTSTPLGPIGGWPQSLKSVVDLMLHSSSMMSLVWGDEAVHLYNDAFMDFLQEHRVASLGRSAFETFTRSRDVFADDLAAGMAGRHNRLLARRYPVLRNGKLEDAWFDVDYSPVHNEAGDVGGVLWSLREVTDQVKSELALRESETRHRLLIESWAQAVWETDARGVVVADSLSWRNYTGQTLEEWLGYGWLDAIHPEDRAYAERQWREAVAARGLVNAEFRLRAAGGGWRWTNVRAAPVLDASGNIEKWAGINIDIDTRKRIEAALRDSEAKYRSLFESMDEAYAVVEVLKDEQDRWVDFRFLDVNPAFLKHTTMPWPVGKTATELLGTPNPRWTELYGQVLDTGKPLRLEEPETMLGLVFDLNIFSLDPERNRVAVLFTNITERKKAEAALRESEERFSQFAQASASGLWIRDANTLAMEYTSPAISKIYGVEEGTLLGEVKRWASLIVPDDRQTTLTHLENARDGKSVIHEFRIQRATDQAFRWVRNTDFPLRDNGGIARIGGIAEDVTEAKLAIEHQGVLLAELQHRVRNIMAMIRSIAVRSAKGADDVEDYRDALSGRLLALARVQALLTRKANAGETLRNILVSEIGAQAHSESQYDLKGPEIMLSPKAVEVLTLAFHELSTNALKYGALSAAQGKVSVTWMTFERRDKLWLAIDWVEEGSPARPRPTRLGFGSELVEGKIPYELRGTGKITVGPGGARCHIEFPLREADSILETDAPRPTKLYGGTLDMTEAPDLSGKTILVVEDDYYIAADTAAALRGAGARVLGPCSTEECALLILQEEAPHAVILDLNLGGGGPTFGIADQLVKADIPFLFLTGYDPDIVPETFTAVERLQKPVPLRDVVEAVSRL